MSVVATLSQAAWLADGTDVGDETHKAGPIAILIIAILCVACFLLFRSMSKHLRRVRDDYPTDPAQAPADDAEPPTVSAGPAGPAAGRSAPKSRPHAPDDSASG